MVNMKQLLLSSLISFKWVIILILPSAHFYKAFFKAGSNSISSECTFALFLLTGFAENVSVQTTFLSYRT